jgi:Cathepsin propeptide inhibitor domain (I29)
MEREMRFSLFKANLREIDELNAAAKAENGSVVFGINDFADLSPEEFKLEYQGIVMPHKSERLLTRVVDVKAFEGESTSVDWTGTLTTPVKEQGGCSTCW